MDLQYIAEINHQPVEHTLSDDYLNTKHAAESYLAVHPGDDYQIISLNDVSLDHLLKEYNLMALLFDPKYDLLYYQGQSAAQLKATIKDVVARYDHDHPKLVQVLKHPNWFKWRRSLTQPWLMMGVFPVSLLILIGWWWLWFQHFWVLNHHQLTNFMLKFFAVSGLGLVVIMGLTNWLLTSLQLRHEFQHRKQLPQIVKQKLT